MEILFANLIVYLTRYAFIIRHFFKNYYIKKSLGILKWACIAYAFTLVNGFYGAICYLFLMIYELLTMLNLNKNILVNAVLFSLSLIFIYTTKIYGVFALLPYIALFIKIVLKPMLKNKDNRYTELLIDLAICIYSYKYNLYVLFIFKVFEILFPTIGNTIKGITDYTNKKTN